MRRRTKAREIAVQFLYQLDLRGAGAITDLESFVQAESEDPQTRQFAQRLIEGAVKAMTDTDRVLCSVTRNWDLKRMATIDRNVLRMAIYELVHCPDIPPKVVINEAIEIGKKFSTGNSGAFINGILDRVWIDLGLQRGEAKASAATEV